MVQTAMARAVASTFTRRVDGMFKGRALDRAATLANHFPSSKSWNPGQYYRRGAVCEGRMQGRMVCVSDRVGSE